FCRPAPCCTRGRLASRSSTPDSETKSFHRSPAGATHFWICHFPRIVATPTLWNKASATRHTFLRNLRSSGGRISPTPHRSWRLLLHLPFSTFELTPRL